MDELEPSGSGPSSRPQVAAGRLRLTLLVVTAALLLITVAGVVVSRQINENAEDAYLEDAMPLADRVNDLELAMVNQQAAVRGYIIAADPALLGPYRVGRSRVTADLAYIEDHTEGHPSLPGLVRRARGQIAQLEGFYADQIARVRDGRLEDARSRITAGEALFGGFRRTADLMLEDTDRFVQDAQADQDQRTDVLTLLLLVIGGGAVGLALFLSVVVPRRAGRLLAELEAERQATSRARAQTARLQELTARLSSAATTDEVANVVLEHGKEATGAAAGSIGLLRDDGQEFVTRGLVGYAPQIAEAFPSYPADATLPIPDAVREGPLWLPSAAAVVERYPHLAHLHTELSHEAVASLPLRLEDRTLGGLTLSFAEPQPFPPGQRAFLESVADLCAQALERSRLYVVQKEIAATLQQGLLPHRLPAVPGVELVARYQAAAESQLVGGDFYDAFEQAPGRLAVVVGDVCGKGPEAAALTSLARHTIRAVADADRSPAEVLDRLNEAMLSQDADGPFLTAFYVQLTATDDGVDVVGVRAGHPYGLIVRRDGLVERFGSPRGQLLGCCLAPGWRTRAPGSAPATRLLLFTDGLTEVRHGRLMMEHARLEEIVRGCARLSSDACADHLVAAASRFANGSLRDDVALLVVRCPQPEPG